MRPASKDVPWVSWLAPLIIAMCSGALGCADAKRRPIGESCRANTDCESGLCVSGLCLDPSGDEDQDGLTNGFEASIGSNPLDGDTDGDGIADRLEVGNDLSLTDTDQDGKADIVESAIADADGDCIPDQYDSQDDVHNSDLSPMIAVVCHPVGICAEPGARLAVVCPDGVKAQCDVTGVVGYSEPEAVCNGRDDNCDGRVDEGFVAGCFGSTVQLGGGSRTVVSARHRATLVLGQPALGQVQSSRHRVILSRLPVFTPPETP